MLEEERAFADADGDIDSESSGSFTDEQEQIAMLQDQFKQDEETKALKQQLSAFENEPDSPNNQFN